MTAIPDDPALGDVPRDLAVLRGVVQGLLVHRDWAAAYGVGGDDLRLEEQNLRSTAEVLRRALELSDAPVTVAREPVDRVLGICRHFTLLHTALLRAHGVPARVRCGFGNYFDPDKWYDHWITERWGGDRWVRDDPQIDALQAEIVHLDFDPYDQPPGRFLTGSEAWLAARSGEVDPEQFGIFEFWGLTFIAGNVITDFACLNKVELLPWDGWGSSSSALLLLVLAGNFVLLIVGWAFVGAASYMLISFWYRRNTATKAGIKAFVINVDRRRRPRARHVLHLQARPFGRLPDGVRARTRRFKRNRLDLVAGCILLLVGAMGKSAQVPFHVWLPDAMEGPTPVSALIHAATMVAAGVYLIVRIAPLLAHAPRPRKRLRDRRADRVPRRHDGARGAGHQAGDRVLHVSASSAT